MNKNTPFFNNFIEAETLTEEEVSQIAGGCANFSTSSFSVSDLTRKYPSDNDEGNSSISGVNFPGSASGVNFPGSSSKVNFPS